jgi:hypothetical protein
MRALFTFASLTILGASLGFNPPSSRARVILIFRQTQPSMTLAGFLPRINCEEDHRPSSLDGREIPLQTRWPTFFATFLEANAPPFRASRVQMAGFLAIR